MLERVSQPAEPRTCVAPFFRLLSWDSTKANVASLHVFLSLGLKNRLAISTQTPYVTRQAEHPHRVGCREVQGAIRRPATAKGATRRDRAPESFRAFAACHRQT